MSEEDKKKPEAKPAAEAKPTAKPAAKPVPEEKPPEAGEFGKFLNEIAIKSTALGVTAEGDEMLEVEAKDLVSACIQLKQKHGMTYLPSISSVDKKSSFQTCSVIQNPENMKRLMIRVSVGKENPVVPTLKGVYDSATWLEREAWDMMGIKFDGHDDLKRILNPDDWEGFPLRKDYIPPLDALNEPLNYSAS